MNQTKTSNQFNNNYHGILNHDGSIKVAKSKIKGKILYFDERSVLVRSRIKSYVCLIHKDLLPMMKFCKVGDTAHVKFRNGEAWIVGYTKQDAKPVTENPTGDKEVSSNMDWMNFFNTMEME